MKKNICILLVFAFVFNINMYAYGIEYTNNEVAPHIIAEDDLIEYNLYNVEEFKFLTRDEIYEDFCSEYKLDIINKHDDNIYFSKKTETMFDNILRAKNNENILKIKQFITNQNYESKGFVGVEDRLLQQLEELSEGGSYLESYKIFIPKDNLVGLTINKAASTESNLGSYNGFYFKGIYSVYNHSYRLSSSNTSKLKSWVGLSIDLSLTFAEWKITVPYSILTTLFSVISNPSDVYNGAWTDTTISEEVTSRIVCIQDKNMWVTSNPNYYVGVISDMAKVIQTYFVMYPNNPYLSPAVLSDGPVKQIYTKNFYNNQATLKEGYTVYIASRGQRMNDYSIPDADEIKWK